MRASGFLSSSLEKDLDRYQRELDREALHQIHVEALMSTIEPEITATREYFRIVREAFDYAPAAEQDALWEGIQLVAHGRRKHDHEMQMRGGAMIAAALARCIHEQAKETAESILRESKAIRHGRGHPDD